jgi:predicted DNA-binding transcriptional regulator AlpA
MKSITIKEKEIPYAFERREMPAHSNRKKEISSYDQLPVSLNADQVAAVLGISRAGAYNLMRSEGFPTLFIGKRMVVPKDRLLEWIRNNTAC